MRIVGYRPRIQVVTIDSWYDATNGSIVLTASISTELLEPITTELGQLLIEESA